MNENNIIHYVNEYQYTFSEKPFNDVDSLVLCQLAYLKMKSIVQAMRTVDEDTKLEMERLFKELFEISQRLVKEEIRSRFEEGVQEIKQKMRVRLS